MPRMTSAEYEAYLNKLSARRTDNPMTVCAGELAEDESKLHQDIKTWCRQQFPPWLVFSGSMAHKTKRTLGEPDLEIWASGGRTLHIELKTKTGKLSLDQLGVQHQAAALGHTLHVVRSMKEFLALVT